MFQIGQKNTYECREDNTLLVFSPEAERVCYFAWNFFFFLFTVSPFVELSLSDWKKAEETTNSHESSAQNWQ
jgi:hypothetical protein